MQEGIIEAVNAAQIIEHYSPDMKVYDIRSVFDKQEAPGIFVIGGFIGELILTLSSIQDYAGANQSTTDFSFFEQDIESFITELLSSDEINKEVGHMTLAKDLHPQLSEYSDPAQAQFYALEALKEPDTHASFGLSFLLKERHELLIGEDLLNMIM